jgi:hypothetical protein
MQLSKFFTLAEMTRSDTATRLGISNLPDQTTLDGRNALEGLKALCTAVLDPLRESTGAAINVSSGYRGPELNARIGGAKKSQHMEGKAADIQSRGMSVLDLFKAVIRQELPYDQVIYEAKSRTSKWVHVSHDPGRPGGRRGAILLADFGADGKVLRYRTISAQQALELTESATRSAAPQELQYEEMADEPETMEAADATRNDALEPGRVTKRRKVRPKAKTSAKARVKTKAAARRKPGTRKAKARKVAKRKTPAKRKSGAKRPRPKASKHK